MEHITAGGNFRYLAAPKRESSYNFICVFWCRMSSCNIYYGIYVSFLNIKREQITFRKEMCIIFLILLFFLFILKLNLLEIPKSCRLSLKYEVISFDQIL